MQFGDRVTRDVSVDYVEGIGGFLLDVVGVWRFTMSTVFGETRRVDAGIVAGFTDEFLLGVDFMIERNAMMDFERNEVRYRAAGRSAVIPFLAYDGTGGARSCGEASKKNGDDWKCSYASGYSYCAEDGERGLFIPTQCTDAYCTPRQ